MKVYLLNPPFLYNFSRDGRWQGASARNGGLEYPKLLSYCTGVLEHNSNEVRLIDAPAKRWDRTRVIQDILSFTPQIVVVDSNFSSLKNDIEVASLIKSKTGATVILVGPPTSQFPEEILKNDGIDIVARLEYDFTIQAIIQAIEKKKSLKGIDGISYKENHIVVNNKDRELSTSEDLDGEPFVSKVYKKHLDISAYFQSQSIYPFMQIFTARGCQFKCSFCSWPETLFGEKRRARSVNNIVDELQFIHEEIPEVKEVFIEDDTFDTGKNYAIDMCREIHRRKLKLIWSCFARPTLDIETMREMKKAGCRLIVVGYESGNDELLKSIHKGVNTAQTLEFTRAAKKAGLLIQGDFMIGLPGETNKTIMDTIKFIKKVKPNILQVAIATPIPGTEFYRWAKQNGYLLTADMNESVEKNGYQKCIISYPDLTNEEIEKYVDKILRGYYLSPSFAPIALSNIFRKNGASELKIMTKSAGSFLKYLKRNS
jgi:radical SAM superfamily enzyme YgiQ (UPF0313 family)